MDKSGKPAGSLSLPSTASAPSFARDSLAYTLDFLIKAQNTLNRESEASVELSDAITLSEWLDAASQIDRALIAQIQEPGLSTKQIASFYETFIQIQKAFFRQFFGLKTTNPSELSRTAIERSLRAVGICTDLERSPIFDKGRVLESLRCVIRDGDCSGSWQALESNGCFAHYARNSTFPSLTQSIAYHFARHSVTPKGLPIILPYETLELYWEPSNPLEAGFTPRQKIELFLLNVNAFLSDKAPSSLKFFINPSDLRELQLSYAADLRHLFQSFQRMGLQHIYIPSLSTQECSDFVSRDPSMIERMVIAPTPLMARSMVIAPSHHADEKPKAELETYLYKTAPDQLFDAMTQGYDFLSRTILDFYRWRAVWADGSSAARAGANIAWGLWAGKLFENSRFFNAKNTEQPCFLFTHQACLVLQITQEDADRICKVKGLSSPLELAKHFQSTIKTPTYKIFEKTRHISGIEKGAQGRRDLDILAESAVATSFDYAVPNLSTENDFDTVSPGAPSSIALFGGHKIRIEYPARWSALDSQQRAFETKERHRRQREAKVQECLAYENDPFFPWKKADYPRTYLEKKAEPETRALNNLPKFEEAEIELTDKEKREGIPKTALQLTEVTEIARWTKWSNSGVLSALTPAEQADLTRNDPSAGRQLSVGRFADLVGSSTSGQSGGAYAVSTLRAIQKECTHREYTAGLGNTPWWNNGRFLTECSEILVSAIGFEQYSPEVEQAWRSDVSQRTEIREESFSWRTDPWSGMYLAMQALLVIMSESQISSEGDLNEKLDAMFLKLQKSQKEKLKFQNLLALKHGSWAYSTGASTTTYSIANGNMYRFVQDLSSKENFASCLKSYIKSFKKLDALDTFLSSLAIYDSSLQFYTSVSYYRCKRYHQYVPHLPAKFTLEEHQKERLVSYQANPEKPMPIAHEYTEIPYQSVTTELYLDRACSLVIQITNVPTGVIALEQNAAPGNNTVSAVVYSEQQLQEVARDHGLFIAANPLDMHQTLSELQSDVDRQHASHPDQSVFYPPNGGDLFLEPHFVSLYEANAPQAMAQIGTQGAQGIGVLKDLFTGKGFDLSVLLPTLSFERKPRAFPLQHVLDSTARLPLMMSIVDSDITSGWEALLSNLRLEQLTELLDNQKAPAILDLSVFKEFYGLGREDLVKDARAVYRHILSELAAGGVLQLIVQNSAIADTLNDLCLEYSIGLRASTKEAPFRAPLIRALNRPLDVPTLKRELAAPWPSAIKTLVQEELAAAFKADLLTWSDEGWKKELFVFLYKSYIAPAAWGFVLDQAWFDLYTSRAFLNNDSSLSPLAQSAIVSVSAAMKAHWFGHKKRTQRYEIVYERSYWSSSSNPVPTPKLVSTETPDPFDPIDLSEGFVIESNLVSWRQKKILWMRRYDDTGLNLDSWKYHDTQTSNACYQLTHGPDIGKRCNESDLITFFTWIQSKVERDCQDWMEKIRRTGPSEDLLQHLLSKIEELPEVNAHVEKILEKYSLSWQPYLELTADPAFDPGLDPRVQKACQRERSDKVIEDFVEAFIQNPLRFKSLFTSHTRMNVLFGELAAGVTSQASRHLTKIGSSKKRALQLETSTSLSQNTTHVLSELTTGKDADINHDDNTERENEIDVSRLYMITQEKPVHILYAKCEDGIVFVCTPLQLMGDRWSRKLAGLGSSLMAQQDLTSFIGKDVAPVFSFEGAVETLADILKKSHVGFIPNTGIPKDTSSLDLYTDSDTHHKVVEQSLLAYLRRLNLEGVMGAVAMTAAIEAPAPKALVIQSRDDLKEELPLSPQNILKLIFAKLVEVDPSYSKALNIGLESRALGSNSTIRLYMQTQKIEPYGVPLVSIPRQYRLMGAPGDTPAEQQEVTKGFLSLKLRIEHEALHHTRDGQSFAELELAEWLFPLDGQPAKEKEVLAIARKLAEVNGYGDESVIVFEAIANTLYAMHSDGNVIEKKRAQLLWQWAMSHMGSSPTECAQMHLDRHWDQVYDALRQEGSTEDILRFYMIIGLPNFWSASLREAYESWPERTIAQSEVYAAYQNLLKTSPGIMDYAFEQQPGLATICADRGSSFLNWVQNQHGGLDLESFNETGGNDLRNAFRANGIWKLFELAKSMVTDVPMTVCRSTKYTVLANTHQVLSHVATLGLSEFFGVPAPTLSFKQPLAHKSHKKMALTLDHGHNFQAFVSFCDRAQKALGLNVLVARRSRSRESALSQYIVEVLGEKDVFEMCRQSGEGLSELEIERILSFHLDSLQRNLLSRGLLESTNPLIITEDELDFNALSFMETASCYKRLRSMFLAQTGVSFMDLNHSPGFIRFAISDFLGGTRSLYTESLQDSMMVQLLSYLYPILNDYQFLESADSALVRERKTVAYGLMTIFMKNRLYRRENSVPLDRFLALLAQIGTRAQAAFEKETEGEGQNPPSFGATTEYLSWWGQDDLRRRVDRIGSVASLLHSQASGLLDAAHASGAKVTRSTAAFLNAFLGGEPLPENALVSPKRKFQEPLWETQLTQAYSEILTGSTDFTEHKPTPEAEDLVAFFDYTALFENLAALYPLVAQQSTQVGDRTQYTMKLNYLRHAVFGGIGHHDDCHARLLQILQNYSVAVTLEKSKCHKLLHNFATLITRLELSHKIHQKVELRADSKDGEKQVFRKIWLLEKFVRCFAEDLLFETKRYDRYLSNDVSLEILDEAVLTERSGGSERTTPEVSESDDEELSDSETIVAADLSQAPADLLLATPGLKELTRLAIAQAIAKEKLAYSHDPNLYPSGVSKDELIAQNQDWCMRAIIDGMEFLGSSAESQKEEQLTRALLLKVNLNIQKIFSQGMSFNTIDELPGGFREFQGRLPESLTLAQLTKLFALSRAYTREQRQQHGSLELVRHFDLLSNLLACSCFAIYSLPGFGYLPNSMQISSVFLSILFPRCCAEISTGQGKTVISALYNMVQHFTGLDVEYVTSNNDLATQTSSQLRMLFYALGIEALQIDGNNLSVQTSKEPILIHSLENGMLRNLLTRDESLGSHLRACCFDEADFLAFALALFKAQIPEAHYILNAKALGDDVGQKKVEMFLATLLYFYKVPLSQLSPEKHSHESEPRGTCDLSQDFPSVAQKMHKELSTQFRSFLQEDDSPLPEAWINGALEVLNLVAQHPKFWYEVAEAVHSLMNILEQGKNPAGSTSENRPGEGQYYALRPDSASNRRFARPMQSGNVLDRSQFSLILQQLLHTYCNYFDFQDKPTKAFKSQDVCFVDYPTGVASAHSFHSCYRYVLLNGNVFAITGTWGSSSEMRQLAEITPGVRFVKIPTYQPKRRKLISYKASSLEDALQSGDNRYWFDEKTNARTNLDETSEAILSIAANPHAFAATQGIAIHSQSPVLVLTSDSNILRLELTELARESFAVHAPDRKVQYYGFTSDEAALDPMASDIEPPAFEAVKAKAASANMVTFATCGTFSRGTDIIVKQENVKKSEERSRAKTALRARLTTMGLQDPDIERLCEDETQALCKGYDPKSWPLWNELAELGITDSSVQHEIQLLYMAANEGKYVLVVLVTPDANYDDIRALEQAIGRTGRNGDVGVAFVYAEVDNNEIVYTDVKAPTYFAGKATPAIRNILRTYKKLAEPSSMGFNPLNIFTEALTAGPSLVSTITSAITLPQRSLEAFRKSLPTGFLQALQAAKDTTLGTDAQGELNIEKAVLNHLIAQVIRNSFSQLLTVDLKADPSAVEDIVNEVSEEVSGFYQKEVVLDMVGPKPAGLKTLQVLGEKAQSRVNGSVEPTPVCSEAELKIAVAIITRPHFPRERLLAYLMKNGVIASREQFNLQVRFYTAPLSESDKSLYRNVIDLISMAPSPTIVADLSNYLRDFMSAIKRGSSAPVAYMHSYVSPFRADGHVDYTQLKESSALSTYLMVKEIFETPGSYPLLSISADGYQSPNEIQSFLSSYAQMGALPSSYDYASSTQSAFTFHAANFMADMHADWQAFAISQFDPEESFDVAIQSLGTFASVLRAGTDKIAQTPGLPDGARNIANQARNMLSNEKLQKPKVRRESLYAYKEFGIGLEDKHQRALQERLPTSRSARLIRTWEKSDESACRYLASIAEHTDQLLQNVKTGMTSKLLNDATCARVYHLLGDDKQFDTLSNVYFEALICSNGEEPSGEQRLAFLSSQIDGQWNTEKDKFFQRYADLQQGEDALRSSLEELYKASRQKMSQDEEKNLKSEIEKILEELAQYEAVGLWLTALKNHFKMIQDVDPKKLSSEGLEIYNAAFSDFAFSSLVEISLTQSKLELERAQEKECEAGKKTPLDPTPPVADDLAADRDPVQADEKEPPKDPQPQKTPVIYTWSEESVVALAEKTLQEMPDNAIALDILEFYAMYGGEAIPSQGAAIAFKGLFIRHQKNASRSPLHNPAVLSRVPPAHRHWIERYLQMTNYKQQRRFVIDAKVEELRRPITEDKNSPSESVQDLIREQFAQALVLPTESYEQVRDHWVDTPLPSIEEIAAAYWKQEMDIRAHTAGQHTIWQPHRLNARQEDAFGKALLLGALIVASAVFVWPWALMLGGAIEALIVCGAVTIIAALGLIWAFESGLDYLLPIVGRFVYSLPQQAFAIGQYLLYAHVLGYYLVAKSPYNLSKEEEQALTTSYWSIAVATLPQFRFRAFLGALVQRAKAQIAGHTKAEQTAEERKREEKKLKATLGLNTLSQYLSQDNMLLQLIAKTSTTMFHFVVKVGILMPLYYAIPLGLCARNIGYAIGLRMGLISSHSFYGRASQRSSEMKVVQLPTLTFEDWIKHTPKSSDRAEQILSVARALVGRTGLDGQAEQEGTLHKVLPAVKKTVEGNAFLLSVLNTFEERVQSAGEGALDRLMTAVEDEWKAGNPLREVSLEGLTDPFAIALKESSGTPVVRNAVRVLEMIAKNEASSLSEHLLDPSKKATPGQHLKEGVSRWISTISSRIL